MKFVHKIGHRIPEILIAVVWLYVLIPFLAPFAYSQGNSDLGWKINEFYEQFCHQRVERSIYLLGEKGPAAFYTVEQLKEAGAIHPENPNPQPLQWPEYFGHDYVGNSETGWKVPLCIRDIALYGSLALAGTFLIWRKRNGKKNLKISPWVFWVLMLPMIIDGLALTIISIFRMDWVPMWFVFSNGKRILTGVMFGLGAAMLLIPPLFMEKALTKGK